MYSVLYDILFIPFGLYSLYFVVTGIFSFIALKKGPERTGPRHSFAAVIPARNESNVISALIESLRKQNYPGELFDIFVVPNNCSDATEEVARAAGARIIRVFGRIRTKGSALKQAFGYLMRYYHYDAFVVFDADNIVHPDFLSRMNDALCAGYEVAQGYRDSKNPSNSWISGNTSIYYWLINIFFNRARRNMGQSATINGTGFMVKSSLIGEIGYRIKTLTEDIEFSIQCALAGRKILFAEDAVVYDEQPNDLLTSLKQRKRWSAGSYQCLFRYHGELMKKAVFQRNFQCIDMLMMGYAPLVQIMCFIITIVLFAYKLSGVEINNLSAAFFTYYELYSILITYVLQVVFAVFTVILAHKDVRSTMVATLLFPIFWLTWLPLNILCLFKNNIAWEPIRHTGSMDVQPALREYK